VSVPGSRGCTAPAHRELDFWVGKWDVYGGASTTLVGNSIVDSELDGCVIVENWTSAFQGSGRSLNAYDASTGTWSQMWVGSGGCPFGTIMMDGTFADGSMTLLGRREQPAGFIAVAPCGPPTPIVVFSRRDLFRWTPLESGSVLQQFTGANNENPLPALAPPVSLAGLRYDRVVSVTPLNPALPSFCPTRAAAKQFDFMLGTWNVHQGEGQGTQGTAVFRKDQRDCLVEERFTGPAGYAGLSFNTFDVFTQEWVRTYVDNDGQRILMTGGLEDGAMVLVGTRRGATGDVQVRISWRPTSADRVVQRWEYSRDGGTRWQAGREVVYTRS
jgi:hypothetical protein